AHDQQIFVAVAGDVIRLDNPFDNIKNSRRSFPGPDDKITLAVRKFQAFFVKKVYEPRRLPHRREHIGTIYVSSVLFKGCDLCCRRCVVNLTARQTSLRYYYIPDRQERGESI